MQNPTKWILRDTATFLLPLLAIAAGDFVANGVHLAFGSMSPSVLDTFAEIGWLIEASTLAIASILIYAYWIQRNDPLISMALTYGGWGILLFLLLGFEAGIALVQVKNFSLEWFRAFGILTVKFSSSFLVMVAVHLFKYPLADLVRRPIVEVEKEEADFDEPTLNLEEYDVDEQGRSWLHEGNMKDDGSTRAILDSFDEAFRIVITFDFALFAALAFLELAGTFHG